MANSTRQFREMLGARFRDYRMQQGMSIDDLASRLKVTRWTIMRIEAGTTSFSIDRLHKIMTVLGINISLWHEKEQAFLHQTITKKKRA